MAHRRDGLLAQIEAGVLDDTVSLSSLLQKCIVLGGQAGSEKMRDWARRELNGYTGTEPVPDYRHVPAPLIAQITNLAGYKPISQQIHASDLPEQVRKVVEKDVDLEVALLGGGVGELEALAAQGKDEHHLMPPWGIVIQDVLNKTRMAPNSRVALVYWAVSSASLQGLLVRVRTALAELVAELIALLPKDQEVPDKLAADLAVTFVITGDRPTIQYVPQHATDGGTNISMGTSTSGPVTVSGTHGTAIGSQTASGTDSSVVGSQAVNGEHNTLVGRDDTDPGAAKRPDTDGWWARLRKRGAIVAFSTIVGGVAAVLGTIVGMLALAGWKP